jgi:hypothetical protein
MIGKPTFSTEVEKELDMIGTANLLQFTFIPKNRCGVREGYYDHGAIDFASAGTVAFRRQRKPTPPLN